MYDNLCKELGIAWNYESPYNKMGVYTNCAMHAAGDRATYGCGPDNANTGGFCPQMTLAYSPRFSSEDHAAAYLARCNNYVDYWRSLYPSGVAVGTNHFCPDGGCLGLFLNRYDLFEVFLPDLGGAWVEYNQGSKAPTISPAPTFEGGCKDPRNSHLDRCFRPARRGPGQLKDQAWDALGSVGRLSIVIVCFMALTLAISMFVARARRKKRRGESYMQFLVRDMTRRKRKKHRGRHKTSRGAELAEGMLDRDRDSQSRRSRSRRSRSKAKTRSGSSLKSGRSSRSRSANRKQRRKEVLDLAERTSSDNRQQLV
uniref:Uncharacterized protein n=1 Tax=Cyclophora tenuis TaxID=216820 RepID=A0A7S1GH83_CYCTE